MGLPAPQLDSDSSPAPARGGGGVQPPLPDLVKPVGLPPSPRRTRPRMPHDRQEAKELLESVGIDAAVGVAWAFEPAQVRAVVARWEERCENGDDLGPGWIVWRLKQGPVKAQVGRRTEGDWFEERYRRGKPGGTLKGGE